MAKNLSDEELFEALGYLSNARVILQYDVQVPPAKLSEFKEKYMQLTGLKPHGPGYSVLGEYVDKRSVQYRISYFPEGAEPSSLVRIATSSPGTSKRRRTSNQQLLWKMFSNGFILGSPPDRKKIATSIPPEFITLFEFGYSAALSEEKSLEHEEFDKAFSSVDNEPKGDFSPYDEQRKTLVHSARLGRSAAFRNLVLNLYNQQCCVCNNSLVDLSGIHETEAAHIVPKRISGTDDIRNGLALCRKHHWAFDRGIFCIDDKYRIVVPKNILEIPENVSLLAYNGNKISLSSHSSTVPHPLALKWHRKNIMPKN